MRLYVCLTRNVSSIRDSERVSYIALWGRSMGAATALMHGERDPSIAAMVGSIDTYSLSSPLPLSITYGSYVLSCCCC